MNVTQKSYMNYDIDLVFTKNEILEIYNPVFITEDEAKKTYFRLVSYLKRYFESLKDVMLDFPNKMSSGNALFKLTTSNEKQSIYLNEICLKIIEPEFLLYFSELDIKSRQTFGVSSKANDFMNQNFHIYFSYHLLNDSLPANQSKVKKNKI